MAQGVVNVDTRYIGRNQGQNHVYEERSDKRRQGASYRGHTLQRVADDLDVDARTLARALDYPNVKIPNDWWFNEFLPRNVFNRQDDNGQDLHRGVHKNGPHLQQLEHLDVRAPTKKRFLGRDNRVIQVVANARPLYLYEKKNTIDRPANEKHCAYGKIRDPTTNSWRCIKNPNHHAHDTVEMH